MKRTIVFAGCVLLGQTGFGQSLTITNVRVIDGAGGVIDRGNIVIVDGRIEAVTEGEATVPRAAQRIDAPGMVVMPGFIDAHRHVIEGDPQTWLRDRSAEGMQQYLDAGFTTVLASGDDTAAIVELRRRLRAGELAGPRLLVSGEIVRVDQTPDEARAVVRRLAAAEVDVVKAVYNATPDGAARATLEAIVDEAGNLGLETMVHAVGTSETLTAVQAGANRLVHTPHTGALDRETAGIVAAAGIPMTSTLGVFVPRFDAENDPRWRDGSPFPEGGIQRAGQGPANGRLLYEAGVVYGFGTDTRFAPRDSLAHELKPLNLLFSPRDIVQILTANAAAYLGLEHELGTLEPGKAGDLVIIDGDPLADSNDVLRVEAVIQAGRVVAANVSDHNDFLARDIERARRR